MSGDDVVGGRWKGEMVVVVIVGIDRTVVGGGDCRLVEVYEW